MRAIDQLSSLRQRSETAIVSAILDALRSVPGVVAWRNNTGAVTVPARNGSKRRFVRFGQPGMSDIIGWRREYIAAMGAQTYGHCALFLALEVKRPGKCATPEQAAFLKQVSAAGGIAAVVTSVDEALAAVRGGGA